MKKLIFVLLHLIDGKLYPAGVGDVVFLSSNIPHTLINVGKGDCEYFAFQWEH